MNYELKDLLHDIECLESSYEEDPTKICFLLILTLNNNPISDQELDHLMKIIRTKFHHHGEKHKVDEIIKKIHRLREKVKHNNEFDHIVHSKIRDLISNPKVLDYLRKSKQINHQGMSGT